MSIPSTTTPSPTSTPTYPCSVHICDHYAPNHLRRPPCITIFHLRVRNGLPPFLLPRFQPLRFRSTPPSLNRPLPLVYLTRLTVLSLMYVTPVVDASAHDPDSRLWTPAPSYVPLLLAFGGHFRPFRSPFLPCGTSCLSTHTLYELSQLCARLHHVDDLRSSQP